MNTAHIDSTSKGTLNHATHQHRCHPLVQRRRSSARPATPCPTGRTTSAASIRRFSIGPYLVGRNLFHIMHHEDADLRIPPSINTLKRVHKLYLRAANILAGRAVPPGENNMEVQHARPAGEVFRVYPGAVLQGPQSVHAPLGRADAHVARRGDAAHGEPQGAWKSRRRSPARSASTSSGST